MIQLKLDNSIESHQMKPLKAISKKRVSFDDLSCTKTCYIHAYICICMYSYITAYIILFTLVQYELL